MKKKLKEKLGDDKVGEMFCLGPCYENKAFHYDGENYAGNDIDKIERKSRTAIKADFYRICKL